MNATQEQTVIKQTEKQTEQIESLKRSDKEILL